MSTTSLMTFAEFEQLPDAPGKRELIDGELFELPPPIFRNSAIANHNPSVFPETGYRQAGGWLQPDLSVTWPDKRPCGEYLRGGPMIAIEILSPSNTAAGRVLRVVRRLNLHLRSARAHHRVAACFLVKAFPTTYTLRPQQVTI